MAWDEEIVTIVRGLINDFGDLTTVPVTNPTYSDDRLSTLILISSQNIQTRVPFLNIYNPDIVNQTLKPDPTFRGSVSLASTRDENFINLVSLKTACTIVMAEVRQYTGQGISVRDGSSSVSLSRNPASLKLMQETYCREFEEAIYIYLTTGGAAAVGEVILGPVKAWYAGGGSPGDADWGTVGYSGRLERGYNSGVGWWGSGPGGYRGSGGNWGN